ncbi:MAG: hypothetical protein ACR2GY_06560 [Phycisphaerales bacterium]
MQLPFFGRTGQFGQLHEHIQNPGLTIVSGPPQIGKTTLLKHFADQLRNDPKHTRIGMADNTEAKGDVLRRAAADAFKSWIKDDGAVAQFRATCKGCKGKVSPSIMRSLGNVALAIGEDLGTRTLSTIFKEGMNLAGFAQEKIQEAGAEFPRLESEQIRALLMLLAPVGQPPAVLILNQWEDGLDIKHDAATLRAFINNIDEWPAVHIILHLRDPSHSANVASQSDAIAIGGEFIAGGGARRIEIGPINFDDDAIIDELFTWLDSNIPGTKTLGRNTTLELIAGNPAVLGRWASPQVDNAVRADPDWLRKTAANAHAYRYPDTISRLETLAADKDDRPLLHVALRLAALPALSAQGWQAAKASVCAGASEDASKDPITELEARRFITMTAGVLGFSHSTEHEAARSRAFDRVDQSMCNQTKLKPFTRDALEPLAMSLAETSSLEKALADDGEDRSRLGLLAAMGSLLRDADGAAAMPRWLAASAATFLQAPMPADLPMLDGHVVKELTAPARTILAAGLNNAVSHSEKDFDRANGFLDELRKLHDAFPDDPAVRELLAMGLVNAFGRAVQADQLSRAVAYAEECASHRDIIRASDQIAGVVQRCLGRALDLAIAGDHEDAGRRLTAVSQAIFDDASQ